MNSFSKISKIRCLSKKQKTPSITFCCRICYRSRDWLQRHEEPSCWRRRPRHRKTSGEKNSLYLPIMKGWFFMLNAAGKYTIHWSYGYRNRSLFSVFFNAWIVEGSQCWITYLRESFMMDKLQQASSAELPLSSFEILFWVFHKDMNNCYWFWISYFWWIYATSKCWNTNYIVMSCPWLQQQPSIRKNWYLPSFSNQPACQVGCKSSLWAWTFSLVLRLPFECLDSTFRGKKMASTSFPIRFRERE